MEKGGGLLEKIGGVSNRPCRKCLYKKHRDH